MSPRSDRPEAVDQEAPFLSHLIELRDRLLRAVLVILALIIALTPFSNAIYIWLAEPLMKQLPAGSTMIAIDVASTFMAPIKLVMVGAIILAAPFWLYQMWCFVAPALYKRERKMVLPLMVSSTLLFYAGIAFAYYIVLPVVFAFFIGTTPTGVSMMTDINKYLDFALTMFFAFGVAFEIPIATILLIWAGITTPASLRAKRPYVIVGAFIIGAVLTPPDVISQTLLALPMCLLFEAGILLGTFYAGKRAPEPDPDGGSGGGPDGGEWRPMSAAQMDAELDRIDAEEKASGESRYTTEGLDDERKILGESGGPAEKKPDTPA